MKIDYPSTLGERVAHRRQQLGLTQEAVAERAELTTQFLCTVENGRSNVRADYIIRLAAALKTSTDYLLTGKVINDDIDELTRAMRQLDGAEYACLVDIVNSYCKSHGVEPSH